MKKKDFLEMMEDVLGVPEGSLTGNESFAEIKWDSLTILGVMAMAKENPGVVVRPEQMKNLKTLDELHVLLSNLAN